MLNPGQLKAATALRGPVLVIAGAGTGKTYTLVHRLVKLVESGIPADSILLLTFTRRAAAEMIERASTLLGGKHGRMAGGTFHSFAHLMLRRYGRDIGLAQDYTVLDQADTFEILSGIRSDQGLSGRGRGFPQRATIAAIISKAVNKQARIKDALAYLRLLTNPADGLSLIRVLMLYEGIGRAGARKIQQAIAGKSISVGLKAYRARGKIRESLDRLAKLMRALEKSAAPPARSLQRVVDHYQPAMKLRFDDWPRRLRDLEQLIAMCKRYRSLASMLTDLTLEPPSTSTRDNLTGTDRGDRLVLSTMHSAKGLELWTSRPTYALYSSMTSPP